MTSLKGHETLHGPNGKGLLRRKKITHSYYIYIFKTTHPTTRGQKPAPFFGRVVRSSDSVGFVAFIRARSFPGSVRESPTKSRNPEDCFRPQHLSSIGSNATIDGFHVKKVLIFLPLLLLLFFLKKGVWTGSKIFLSTPEILGGPVRLSDEHGDRLYYLTSQWEKRISRSGGFRGSSSRRTISSLNVDLWAVDAATAQPVFRKRLKRDKVNGDSAAMGMEQGILWARISELVGIRLSDGAIVADNEKIEARNPKLAGLMPKPPQGGIFLTESMQPLKFDPMVGMIVRLADARQVRIDPLTLEATPYVPDPEGKKLVMTDRDGPEKTLPRVAVERPSNGMDWRAMVRGLAIERPDGGKEWLGLLAESELSAAKERKTISNQMDFSEPRRHRLYRAQLKPIEDFFGPRLQFLDPVALPEGPEFLMAGLLTRGPGSWDEQTALWRREPDSVFVLSRDRLGEEGRLQLARVAGPAGRPVWATALPLSALSAWFPGERHALMLGPDPSATRSPMAEEGENPVLQIVTIDLDTGTLNSFNPDLHRDWPVEEAPKPTP